MSQKKKHEFDWPLSGVSPNGQSRKTSVVSDYRRWSKTLEQFVFFRQRGNEDERKKNVPASFPYATTMVTIALINGNKTTNKKKMPKHLHLLNVDFNFGQANDSISQQRSGTRCCAQWSVAQKIV